MSNFAHFYAYNSHTTAAAALDGYHPLLRGYYASVYEVISGSGGRAALKVMRAEHLKDLKDHVEQAFADEVNILHALESNPAVVKLYEYGFVSGSGRGSDPDGIDERAEIERYRRADLENFRRQMSSKVKDGWRPFLLLEYLDKQHSIFFDQDCGDESQEYNYRYYYPVPLALRVFQELVDLMKELREKYEYYYVDHKLAHIYWQPNPHDRGHIRVTDFNVGRRFVDEASRHTHYTRRMQWDDDRKRFDQDDIYEAVMTVFYPMVTGRNLYPATNRARFREQDYHPDNGSKPIRLPDDVETPALRTFFKAIAAANPPSLDGLREALQVLQGAYATPRAARERMDSLYRSAHDMMREFEKKLEDASMQVRDDGEPFFTEFEALKNQMRAFRKRRGQIKPTLPGTSAT
jgi:serine/threonine protein kinase